MKVAEQGSSEHRVVLRSHVVLEDGVEVEKLEVGREQRPGGEGARTEGRSAGGVRDHGRYTDGDR